MPPNSADDDLPIDRREPVGAPVVRGDPEITGARAAEAAKFDPDDPESLAEAAAVVREFADDPGGGDHLYMLRGAAACAALVRGEGSYKAAADRADVTVGFLRKWARVHDLPIAVRRHIARGEIAPSAAKHIARVTGNARFLLAWAVLESDLSVREVRTIASSVTNGESIDRALEDNGVQPGAISITLPLDLYRELRRQASLANTEPDDVVADALTAWLFDDEPRG